MEFYERNKAIIAEIIKDGIDIPEGHLNFKDRTTVTIVLNGSEYTANIGGLWAIGIIGLGIKKDLEDEVYDYFKSEVRHKGLVKTDNIISKELARELEKENAYLKEINALKNK